MNWVTTLFDFLPSRTSKKVTLSHVIKQPVSLQILDISQLLGKLSQFLGTLAKLRKATISFVMPVLFSAWKHSAPTGRILMEFDV
jgi:hypothetical protein